MTVVNPIVDLSIIESDGFFGILLPWRTGVIWQSQVGGTACFHPQLEGIYVPFEGRLYGSGGGTIDEKDPLYDRVELYNVGLVWRFLNTFELNHSFAPIKTPEMLAEVPGYGRDHLDQPYRLFEAWVPVFIDKHNTDYPQLDSFKGSWGIIVYPNSD